jgi:RimJ/RimL family protein N-acetyltransferase
MNLLFTECKIRKITIGTLELNTAMIRIMTKSIMTHEAIKKDQELFNNKPVDILYFCKFLNDK